jgi:hypothetical protein
MPDGTRRCIVVKVRRLLIRPEDAEAPLRGGRRCRGVIYAVREHRADGMQVSDRKQQSSLMGFGRESAIPPLTAPPTTACC